jgi:hypothetical protein
VRGAEEAIHVHGAMMAAAELRARQGSIQAINPSGVGADRRAGRAGGMGQHPTRRALEDKAHPAARSGKAGVAAGPVLPATGVAGSPSACRARAGA